eukprot:TRINITY_DN1194_c0_g1_i1.p1 TRINITY_DN1194_c0_g1~~TRINITY_DN1194_c0_g1_i1.p1  ORF type:complete len:295 (-),score=80.99 TRINITY_DN1194_c0_g1_i1:130-972(-)
MGGALSVEPGPEDENNNNNNKGNVADIEDTKAKSCETTSKSEESSCECEEKKCNYNPKLVNTVKRYHRHLIICDGKEDWIKKIEREEHSIAQVFKQAAGSFESLPEDKIFMVTAASEKSTGPPGTFDVLVYPEQLRYIGVTTENAAEFFKTQVIEGKVYEGLPHHPIEYKHLVLICTHATRDKRCGRIGPQLVSKLRDLIEERGITDQEIAVRSSSHLGGHKYAAVLTVYPSGEWYGQLSARNASTLLDAYVNSKNKNDLCPNYRGKMTKPNEPNDPIVV